MEPGRAPLGWRLYAMVWLLFAEFVVLHLTAAFAMITQASSVATAYDMWEEREYESATTGVAAASQKAAQRISAA